MVVAEVSLGDLEEHGQAVHRRQRGHHVQHRHVDVGVIEGDLATSGNEDMMVSDRVKQLALHIRLEMFGQLWKDAIPA